MSTGNKKVLTDLTVAANLLVTGSATVIGAGLVSGTFGVNGVTQLADYLEFTQATGVIQAAAAGGTASVLDTKVGTSVVTRQNRYGLKVGQATPVSGASTGVTTDSVNYEALNVNGAGRFQIPAAAYPGTSGDVDPAVGLRITTSGSWALDFGNNNGAAWIQNRTKNSGFFTTGELAIQSEGGSVSFGSRTGPSGYPLYSHGAFGVNGNIRLLGAARRILGDFSNATLADRCIFQDATTNNDTTLGVMPNGTGAISQINLYGTSDPSGCARLVMRGTNTGHVINSTYSGGGTAQAIGIQINGSNAIYVDAEKRAGLNVATSAWATGANNASLDVSTYGAVMAVSETVGVAANLYYDGTWRHKQGTSASLLSQYQGTLGFYWSASAASGTAATLVNNFALGVNACEFAGESIPVSGAPVGIFNVRGINSTRYGYVTDTYGATTTNIFMGMHHGGTYTGASAVPPGRITGLFAREYVGSSTYYNSAAVVLNAEATGATGDAPTYITFEVTPDNSSARGEAARITSASYLLLGYTTSNGAYRLQVNSQIFATNATIATSDARYKENVKPIGDGLNVIRALNPVSFTWKEHPVHKFETGECVGFLAQEVDAVLKGNNKAAVTSIIKKNAVRINPHKPTDVDNPEPDTEIPIMEEFLGMSETSLIPFLVSAVKELSAKVDSLTTELNALKNPRPIR